MTPQPHSALRRAALAAALVLALPAAARAQAGPPDFADLAERLVPSVVSISTSQEVQAGGAPRTPPGSPFEEFFREYFERRGEQPPQRNRPMPRANSLGSGFVVDADGFIVTNNHVIADASEITVTFADGESLPATLVGRDPKTDIAVLKVDPPEPLAAAAWGDSDTARVGNWTIAIGNPFGLGNTVTAGIVSARARDINAGPFDDFIQTDASINRAIRAARCSTWTAPSSASTRRSIRLRAAASASASRFRRIWRATSSCNCASSARRGAAGSACASRP